MEQDSNKQQNGVYSKVIRAGRRRTYFFDVRSTKNEEYYLTVTESKRKFDSDGYERHKVHVYKEDFHKFINAIEDVVGHIKTLMPDYDYDEFTRPVQTIEYDEDGNAIKEPYNPDEDSEDSEGSTESAEVDNAPDVTDNPETAESSTEEVINDDDLKWD